MDIRDRRGLKEAAAQSLARGDSDHKKLILIHTGVILAVSLVLAVLNLLLEYGIAGTGGLSGVGTRSILATVQSILQLGQMAVMPFWQFGWLAASLRLSREERVEPLDLTVGLCRFGPVLRLTLLQGALYAGIGMVAGYLGTTVFLLTPWGGPVMEAYLAAMQSTDMEAAYAAMERAVIGAVVPLLVIYLAVFLALSLPVFYRLRLSHLCLAEEESGKALVAMRRSNRMMRGNVGAMVKLDISFWWFYVLDLLVSGIAFLDVVLPALGVTLPGPGWIWYLGTMVGYSVCQLLLYWRCKAGVDVTYAKALDAIKESRRETPKPVPQNLPWQM